MDIKKDDNEPSIREGGEGEGGAVARMGQSPSNFEASGGSAKRLHG